MQWLMPGSGNIKSFNYDGGYHLANQNYQICIRTERNMCHIYYSAVDNTAFQMSGTTASTGYTQASYCSEDYINIPFGHNPAASPSARAKIHRFCGALLVYDISSTTEGTIRSSVTPFMVGVWTDGGESDSYASSTYSPSYSKGFHLFYEQFHCPSPNPDRR